MSEPISMNLIPVEMQSPLTLLFLLPDFPYPASTGGRLKVFNILKHMSKRHHCDIVCFGLPELADTNNFAGKLPNVRILDVVAPVSGVARQVGALWHILRLLPPSFASFADDKFASSVENALASKKYDVIHFDIVNMAQYLSFASKTPTVHSPNDATSSIYFQMAENTKWWPLKIKLFVSAVLLKRYERRIYPSFNMTHVVSREDALYLHGLNPAIKVSTIPIAVDEAFLNGPEVANIQESMPNRSFRIVCNGNLGNPAIAEGVSEFLSKAFPLILSQWPDAQFVVLGQNIERRLLKQLTQEPNVDFLPWVDDYRTFLAGADVVLVPDHVGAPGAKTRTLQAMGIGVPVVGTATAFAGIPFVNRVHGLTYKTMPECAEVINSLLRSKQLREVIGKNARELVVGDFSLSMVGPKYEKMYYEAVVSVNARNPVSGTSL